MGRGAGAGAWPPHRPLGMGLRRRWRRGGSDLAEGLHVEVAVGVDPFLVGFDGEGAGQTQAGLSVGEDAHDVGASLQLLVEAFKQVGRLEVFVVGAGQPLEGEGLLDVFLHPAAQPGMFRLPALQPA
jgi:hypothetical protein